MKDFETWCKKKQIINKSSHGYPKHREVWWASLGLNIGHEQDGVGSLFERPVLIIKKFANNTCLVIPITKAGSDSKFYYKLPYGESISYLALTQIRVLSSKRLSRNIRRLEPQEFIKVIDKMKIINGIK